MALDVDDLSKLKTLAVQAMNQARARYATLAGEDYLAALACDGFRAQPQLGEAAKQAGERVAELGALADRVGVALDDACVAADPERRVFFAAHDRVRDRRANTAEAPF